MTTGSSASASQDRLPPRRDRAGTARRLPRRQPARALVVVLGYAVSVGLAGLALHATYGLLGIVFTVFLAGVLLIPVAVLAPRPRAPLPDLAGPLLRRGPHGTMSARDVVLRVDGVPVEADLEVQVRTGDVAGRADATDDLPAPDRVAGPDVGDGLVRGAGGDGPPAP